MHTDKVIPATLQSEEEFGIRLVRNFDNVATRLHELKSFDAVETQAYLIRMP